MSDIEASFPGTYEFDVEFGAGPKQGEKERHKIEFTENGRVLLHLPPIPGAGWWTIDDDGVLSFDFHEVVLDEERQPTLVIHIGCEGVQLEAGANGFEGDGLGKIYAAPEGLNLIGTQAVSQVGWKEGTGGPGA